MIEREKVVKGLKCCVHDYMGDCDNCPYNDDSRCCDTKLMRDAIALLDAGEPPTSASISSAIEYLLHPQDADDSDMTKAINTAVRAMRLLKAQEPVKPKMMEFVDEGLTWEKYEVPTCGACGALLADALFCPMCGQAVKWE